MKRCTGIELGPSSCVLAAAAPGGADAADVSAVHVLDAASWPAHDEAMIATLRAARRSKHFPRRAAVVMWGLDRAASLDDAVTQASLRPVVEAGFKVISVLAPPEALALVAASRPRPDSGATVAWAVLNTHGVAIAIVRDNTLLFSRAFDWSYRPDVGGSKAQLLQRYTLISHLAPELQRGFEQVRQEHGAAVETIVICGDLPELRSLTMPLIEELDMEVETLDSTDGLRAGGAVVAESFDQVAPAIRLATAAAVAGASRRAWLGSIAVRSAAALVAAAALGWAAYALWPQRAEDRPRQPAAPIIASADPPVISPSPAATTGVGTRPPERASEPVDERATPAPPPAEAAPVRPPAVKPPAPAPLSAPRPRVESILIDHNRRLAVIDGAIVRVGDRVGPRTVAAIEQEAVVFREPSGLQIRVRLGGRDLEM